MYLIMRKGSEVAAPGKILDALGGGASVCGKSMKQIPFHELCHQQDLASLQISDLRHLGRTLYFAYTTKFRPAICADVLKGPSGYCLSLYNCHSFNPFC